MKLKLFILTLLFPLLTSGQEWTAKMDSLAKVTESKYNLPHGICQAFALQESNYNKYAVRAEANYLSDTGRYAMNIKKASYKFSKEHNWQPSVLTEIVQRSQSYTMFQIMGSNLRELGLQVPFFEQDLRLKDQFEYFAKFISRLLKKHNGNISYTASEYNGGYGAIRGGNFRNKKYVDNILRNIEKFKY